MVHLPVMFKEVLEQLAIRQDGFYLDCTFGRGGHSGGILTQLGATGRLLALDRDVDAISSEAANVLAKDSRVQIQHCCFSALAGAVSQAGGDGLLDGVLMDLGVSSPQLDNAERGFSFLRDGPLDMRMDTSAGLSAQQWLATVAEQHLVKVLFEYGEERYARRIAAAIVAERAINPITSTRQLAKLIENTIPNKEKHKHPATRTFQAIRIEINQELEELKAALQQSLQVLKPGGRLVVIAFHSLEDRLVKRFINNEAGAKHHPGKLPIREVDIVKGDLKKMGKAIKASAEETRQNIRARSAIMRVAEKV
ncbi:MAG: 16S rRNA (cytosine(1402)-N(4))-methyltransferase RsmH [Methylococcales bacterium]|nr:16S rRNA (cytosine(1402)-N(4))-methyltransferase RsmH [Methylococcales bacterium]